MLPSCHRRWTPRSSVWHTFTQKRTNSVKSTAPLPLPLTTVTAALHSISERCCPACSHSFCSSEQSSRALLPVANLQQHRDSHRHATSSWTFTVSGWLFPSCADPTCGLRCGIGAYLAWTFQMLHTRKYPTEFCPQGGMTRRYVNSTVYYNLLSHVYVVVRRAKGISRATAQSA